MDWLKVAQEAFSGSTSYMDANWRKDWERNIALFQSRHPAGSKYNSDAYKRRSRLFRPKTKSVVRKNEAAAAAAFFSNVDVVSIEPANNGDQLQAIDAALMGEVVNYRLTRTIPWFQTLIGAVQDAQVIGLVASYQYWKFKEKREQQLQPSLDPFGQPMADENGTPMMEQVETSRVVKDEPCVELLPIENLRFDPGADWTDIVGTSPYLIRLVPMYVDDVQGLMAEGKWRQYDEAMIKAAMSEYDTMRSARENKREDPRADNGATIGQFEIIWCHQNFIRLGGEEFVYWTLGDKHLLTDPAPLESEFHHGERPFVIGCAVIESHKAVPDSLVAIGSELQREVNETVNSRRDNVALVLNKRYIVKRNAQVDVDSLLRNVPGAVTLANETTDVQELNWPDVTGSAYQEQDRLNVDFDELTGNFSQGTVQTNRALNETVGGMRMISGGASQMTEYMLRTFTETWVEPVLRQLVLLEKHYESDLGLLMTCGASAGVMHPQAVLQRWHQTPMDVSVNVGMGATDPQAKLHKFTLAVQTYGAVLQTIPDADPEAIRREVFGLAGYKDGGRFFKGENPVNARLQAQLQQMGAELQKLQQQNLMYQIELKNREGELKIQAFDAQTKRFQATKAESPNSGPTAIDIADAQTKRIDAVANARLKGAQTDLAQAQAVETLVNAAIAPTEAMARQAADAERTVAG